MTRRQRILHRLTWLLVATIGVIAFTASFEAIADYAGQVGWGPHMKYAAPLLVDTFTVAAGLVILARAEAGVRAVYAWTLLVAAAAVSIGLNIAHAPPHLAARVVAALPPAALLAAVELAMSEARRSRKKPTAEPIRESVPGVGERAVSEGAPNALPVRPAAGSSRVRPRNGGAPAPGRTPAPRSTTTDRDTQRARVIQEHSGESDRKIIAAVRAAGVGCSSERLAEDIRRIKAGSNGAAPPEREQVKA